nr:MAG TPA: hypothetical protein [Caudoviricetes sp.]DAQ57469.1 MAG TPA: hypothetical protein [Bacteriophage sp.]DAS30378.1 MAG TPA: hypothetical protein [Bacteriophage sp.]
MLRGYPLRELQILSKSELYFLYRILVEEMS